MWNSKDVYYVSDSTAILAEDMGQAILCQFHEVSFNEEKIPFVRTTQDAQKAIDFILSNSGGRLPIVFCTITHEEVRNIINSPQVEFIDVFGGFLEQLEQCLETKALREPGFSRQVTDVSLATRVDAIHYSLEHDDGVKTWEYDKADIILVGVSRSGKTPVSVYLATQMGFKAANFPLTEDHLDSFQLPKDILRNRKKVIGLTTTPETLHKIREQRYKGSSYAKISTCSIELQQAQQMFGKAGIQVVDSGGKSIEEIAVQATQLLGLSKKRWPTG